MPARLAWLAFEIHASLIEGSFDQARAECYARELLMPAKEFGLLTKLADGELAEHFGMPVEQVGGGVLRLARRSAAREAPP